MSDPAMKHHADSLVQGVGMKYDADKNRVSLILSGCPKALLGIGEVLTFGAKKYAAHSWQTVPHGEERYKDAMYRHLLALESGEEVDKETGLPHLYHAACNMLFITELYARKKDVSN